MNIGLYSNIHTNDENVTDAPGHLAMVHLNNHIVVVRCHNVKNGKEASEVTEGKSTKMRSGR